MREIKAELRALKNIVEGVEITPSSQYAIIVAKIDEIIHKLSDYETGELEL